MQTVLTQSPRAAGLSMARLGQRLRVNRRRGVSGGPVLEEARMTVKAEPPAPPTAPGPHFNEADCGGVFDGNRVWSDTEIDGAPGF